MRIILQLSLFIIVFLFLSCKKEKNRICDVYNGDVGYAIGNINAYVSTSFVVNYKYSYTVNTVEYLGNEKAYGLSQLDERLIGKNFIVVYSKDDNAKSDLNTNYLIKTQQDFIDFETEFSTSPPSPDFPNKCK